MTKDKLPPQALDAEEAVLGSIFIDPDNIAKVGDIINKEDFYSEAHGEIYNAFVNLSDKNQPIDLITVSQFLKDKKQFDNCGGNAKLAELTMAVPSASHILDYAGIVKSKAVFRNLIKAGDQISGIGYDEKENSVDAIDKAEKKVFEVGNKIITKNFTELKNVLADNVEAYCKAKLSEDEKPGVMTDFFGIDNHMKGFQPSDMIVLAARPSMGKSGFAMNLGVNAACKGKKVAYFSLEMSKDQIGDRIIASETGINPWKLKEGIFTDEEFEKVTTAVDKLSAIDFYIDDCAELSMVEMRAKARRLKMEHGLDMLIIDYMQLIKTGNKAYDGNRVQEVSEISRNVKALARELDIPILVLSQLSREVEKRKPQIPQLADLRESGSIEQDADIVMMMYREDYYEPETNREGVTDIFIRKNRNGPIGHFDIYFNKDKCRFKDISTIN